VNKTERVYPDVSSTFKHLMVCVFRVKQNKIISEDLLFDTKDLPLSDPEWYCSVEYQQNKFPITFFNEHTYTQKEEIHHKFLIKLE
jgi:hypothetical protein